MLTRSVYDTLSAGANTLVWKVGNRSDLLLLGINLEETDSSDNPQPDSGSVYIQDPSEANSLSLAHGGMVNGQLSAFGCLPLNPGAEIIGKVWHARAGNVAKLNVYIASIQDVKDFGLYTAPNWTQRQPSPQMLDYGIPKVELVIGDAADTQIEVRPDDGYIWRVLDMVGYHDDSSARDLTFGYSDGTTTFWKQQKDNLGATQRWHLTANSQSYDQTVCGLMVINYRKYVVFKAEALTAGKKLYVGAFVLEYAE